MSNFVVFVFIHTQNLFYIGDVDRHFQGPQKSLPGYVLTHPHLSSPAVPLPDDQNPKMQKNILKALSDDIMNNGW